MSTFWLSADEKYYSDYIDFTAGVGDLVIPVVMLQTGSSRAPLYPGVYRSPRIRTYSDKFGAPTTITSPKEITFSAAVFGKTMDEIYAKFQQINSYLDRAEIAASPFPRGSGVVLIEQLNDAAEITVWDVLSGVLTDVDFNLPGVNLAAAVVQLTVLPFSRGTPRIVDFGSTLTNGTNAGYYLPYQGGDGPGLFELRLKDTSVGKTITWIGVGVRSYPYMSATDFTPWYLQGKNIATTGSWQKILQQTSAPGKHQTGLFGVYAIVNDMSEVIQPPESVMTSVSFGGGSLPNGLLTIVLAPKNAIGLLGETSSRNIAVIGNPNQPGNVQAEEGFEDGTFNSFTTLPTVVIPGAGTASVTIDSAAAIVGNRGAHFRVQGDAVAGSITSATIGQFMPNLSGLGTQSIAYKINPVSWGSFGTLTGVIPDPAVMPAVTVLGPVPNPSAPVIGYDFSRLWNAPYLYSRMMTIAYTWINSIGETLLSTPANEIMNGRFPTITIPPFPPGVLGARIYFGMDGIMPVSLDHDWQNPPGDAGTVFSPGTYALQPKLDGSRIISPPGANTTFGTTPTFAAGTYDFGYTWTTATGETKLSPINFVTFSTPGIAQITIPAFPLTVTGAKIYVSLGSGAGPSLAFTASSSGVTAIGQGNGVTIPPTLNSTGVNAGGNDRTPRFSWGSLSIIPTGSQNNFACTVGGTQVGSAFNLATSVVHQIGISFRQVGVQAVYSIIVDGTLVGSRSGQIGTLDIPVTATWAAIGAGSGGPFLEEYYLDEIYVYDALLQPNFDTTGSAVQIDWANGLNTTTMDLYFSLQPTGLTTTPVWYLVQGVAPPYILGTPIPLEAQLVSGPPTSVPSIANAQLMASVGVGSNPTRFMDKTVVRTQLANGLNELVRLGSIELPPGSKSDSRDLDSWSLAVWGKSGGLNSDTLTIQGIVLFPEDEEHAGWTGITAKAFGLSGSGNIWRIGTNRYGRSYAQIFASDGTTLLGYGDVSGAISSGAGDNQYVVLVGRDDGSGDLVIDLSLTYQLSCRNVPRFHFENTTLGLT
jgi:hypothetical protein